MPKNEVSSWLDTHTWLRDFEGGGSLPDTPEEKWRFYFNVQEALRSLPAFVSPSSKVSKSSEYTGQVVIEAGAQILPGAFVEGPAYIGKGVLIGNCALIRPRSFISKGAIIGNHCYCAASILGPKAGVFHFCGVSRSLLEKNCRLTAFVITATARPDLKSSTRHLPKGLTPSPIKRGCIIGENTFISAHVVIFQGAAIGHDCFIGSHISVAKDIPNGTKLETSSKTNITQNKILTAEAPKYPSVSFGRQ